MSPRAAAAAMPSPAPDVLASTVPLIRFKGMHAITLARWQRVGELILRDSRLGKKAHASSDGRVTNQW